MGSIFSLEKKCLMYPAPAHLHRGGGNSSPCAPGRGDPGGQRMSSPLSSLKDLTYPTRLERAKGPVQAADICHNGRPPGFPTALPPQHRLGRASHFNFPGRYIENLCEWLSQHRTTPP